MFKSCCTCPGKKISKSKSKPENLDKNSTAEPGATDVEPRAKAAGFEETAVDNPATTVKPLATNPEPRDTEANSQVTNVEAQRTAVDPQMSAVQNELATVEPPENTEEMSRNAGRRSIEFDRRRLSRDESKVLEELTQLEEDLARTNVDVRPVSGRRKSNGILKSTTSYGDPDSEKRPSITASLKQDSCEDDDEVFSASGGGSCGSRREGDGTREPPATPVGRDELALRRHRFFSDLVSAARAAVEHRVRFDPLGPHVEDNACDPEALASLQGPAVQFEALIGRLERVAARLERLPQLRTRTPSPSPPPATPPPASPLPPPPEDGAYSIVADNMSVNGFEDIVAGPLQTYLGLSRKIGGDVATHANLVNAAFQAQLGYIHLAASRAKPSQSEEMNLLAPTSQQISSIQQFREKNRTSPFFNHLSAISESIPALGWVAVSPAPSPYVKEMNDAGQFYTNRVLKEWKGKDASHAEWCRAWVQLLQELQAYVKQHHTTGLVWSGRGGGCGAPPPPPPGGMPPPPPVLPPADFADLSIDDRSALFAQINQGENITSSLKKVTSEMQTHKNPTLRQGPAPYKPAPPPNKPFSKGLPAPGAGQLPEKPPVFTRDGKKWLIEYQRGNQGLVVENAEMNNVVYMFRCRDSALTVRGKINGVVLDSCTKCAVVFDNLVSSVEFVNCQSVQMQVLGKVPTISIDKTDGCQMYLSAQSLDVEIVSSKSSEMNVLVPKSNGDYTEFPVPEQFKTMLNAPRTGLATEPVESKG